MRIDAIRIDHLPGIDDVEVADLGGSDVCVVAGANATGKSSLVRALDAVVWGIESDVNDPARVQVRASWSGVERGVAARGARTTTWSDASGAAVDAPNVPAEHHRQGFAIRIDELARLSASDTEIETSIVAQLSDGVNMTAARDRLAPQASGLLALGRQIEELDGELHALVTERKALAGEYEQLEARRAEQAQLRRAREGREADKTALRLVGERTQLAEIREALGELPVTKLEHVRAGDGEQLTRLVQARNRCDAALQTASERLDVAQRAETEAANGVLDARERAELHERAEQLMAIETELAAARRELDGMRAELEQIEQALAVRANAGDPASEAVLDDERVRSLADLWRAQLTSDQDTITCEAALDRIDAAIEESQRRISVVDRPRGDVVDRSRTPWIGHVALLVASLGIAAWIAVDLGSVTAWIVVGALASSLALGIRARSVLRARTESTASDATADEADAEHARLLGRRDAAREDAEAARETAAAARAALAQHARALGADPTVDTNALVAVAMRRAEQERLRLQHAALQASAAGRAATIHRAERDHAATLEAIAAICTRRQLDAPADAAAARGLSQQIDERARSAEMARTTTAQAREQLTIEQSRREEASELLEEFCVLRQLDAVGDAEQLRLELAELEAMLPRFTQLVADQRALEQAITAAEDQLAADTEGRIELDADTLRARIDVAVRADERYDELTQEIARIGEAVAAARRDGKVEQLAARHKEVRDELASAREEYIVTAAAQLLLEEARDQYRADAEPALLAEANRILEAATDHVYRLDIHGDQLVARVSNAGYGSETRALTELSSGTRAQALIAVRIAHARSVEHPGEPMPIFIDEALATTDPQRFDAIVRVLGEIARDEHRQIIMLTTDPRDGARIDAALTAAGLPTAAHRSLAGTTLVDTIEQLPARVPIPTPEPDEDAESYARRIGVTATLDLHEPIDSQHVWHLLEPQLDAVHALVDRRCTTIGQLRRQLAEGLLAEGAGSLSEDDLRDLLTAADATARNWQRASARPIRTPEELRELLVAAGVNDGTWLAPLWEVVERTDGSVFELLSAIDRKEVLRFRDTWRQQLQDAITASDRGYLPREPELDEATIIARVEQAIGGAATRPARMLANRWLMRSASLVRT